MRLLTFRTDGGTRAGRLDGDQVVELADADVGALLARGDAGVSDARNATGAGRPLAGLDLAPVVLDPPKIICVGQNYLAHITEQGAKVPEYPTLFNKFRRSLIGAHDEIVLPRVSTEIDWEVELTIVIGKHARHVSGAAAEDAIFGYTILNDTSIRDWQRRTTQWMQGKAFEASTPIGPAVVSKDELDAGNLRLWTQVDGKLMQDSTTSDLLFKLPEVVAYCSEIFTLEPGDVIATGTPSGVGFARNPPVFLQPGQTVRCSVEGIGSLVNRAVKETG
jgi:acylpyruvate hydrolase